MLRASNVSACAALMGIAGLVGSTSAGIIPEVEPNDNKAAATIANMLVGDSLVGVSTGSSLTVPGLTSADYWRVNLAPQAVGIYRNRLTITTPGTAGHTGTIRGLGQTATGPSGVGPGFANPAALDNTIQTSSTTTTPPRFNQFYTFGHAASLYYRVTGSTSTTAEYTSTHTQELITPISLGSFATGSFTFTNTGLLSTQDTEVFLYDGNLQPVLGALNDDFLDGTVVPAGGSTLNSLLTRTILPGTYYLAIANFNTADNQFSPFDEGTASGNVLDFPGVMANSSTTVLASIPFRMVHPDGTLDFTASKPGAFDIWWGTFTVVPAPGSAILLGMGGLLAARRRR